MRPRYDRLLAGAGIGLPGRRPAAGHVYHVYAVRLPDRDAVQRRLARAGIATGIHYPMPVHLQPAYADLGHGPGDFPRRRALRRRDPVAADVSRS